MNEEIRLDIMISKKRYDTLKKEHKEGCETSDYRKIIMVGDKNDIKMKEYEAQYICKHSSVDELMGG